MDKLPILINNILLAIAAILFIKDSIVLFIRGKNNRARRMMGVTTLIWGVMYLFYLILSLDNKISYPVFSGEALISSHVFICVMFFFPLEVLLPGWLSCKRVLMMLTPIITLSFIYYAGLHLTGQHIENFYSLQDCLSSLGHFNVWYRLVLLTCNIIFLFMLLHLLKVREVKYIKWQNENFSDLDSVDISWIRYYRHMMIIIISCYIVVAVWGGVWSIIAHTMIVIVCFSILSYKGLFYENSYSEDLSVAIDGGEPLSFPKGETLYADMNENPINERSFEAKLSSYVAEFKHWMETEKPYLHQDFKLVDVTKILPLNRSYLSRVFNEGYHQNFSEVVRNYRIEHAKRMITEEHELPLYKIAELCGFTSDTTFIRAFQKVVGMTPKQFKNSLQEQ